MKKKIMFKEMTDAELDNQIGEMRKEKFNLGAQAKSGQLENPAKLKQLRRNIARALTEKQVRNAKAANA